MYLVQNFVQDSYPSGDSSFEKMLRIIFERQGISSRKDASKITSDVELNICEDLFEKLDRGHNFIIRTKEIKIPMGFRYHYFIMNAEGFIMDVLAWLYVSLEYDDPQIIQERDLGRANPAPKNNEVSLFSDENMPLILWSTVRAIFLKNSELSRNYKKEIAQIYKEYLQNDGTTPSQTLSRIFAIAVKSLQRKKYLKEGTRTPSTRGRERSNELETYWGLDGTRKKLKQFEEILRQGRAK